MMSALPIHANLLQLYAYAHNAKYLHFLKNLSTHDNDVFKNWHMLFLRMRSD